MESQRSEIDSRFGGWTLSVEKSSNIRRRSWISSDAMRVIRTSTMGPWSKRILGYCRALGPYICSCYLETSLCYRHDDRRARHIAADDSLLHVE